MTALLCRDCGAENETDAAYCDQCGGSLAVPRLLARLPDPPRVPHAQPLLLALTTALALVTVLKADWPRVSELLARRSAERGVQESMVREAEERPVPYEQAAFGPRLYDGRLVAWWITPAGPGRAFHQGDFRRPIRLLSPLPWPHEGLGGKATASLKLLGRVKWDGKWGVALEVVGVL